MLKFEFLFTLSADVGELMSLGPCPLGERRVVYITGGTFEGPAMRGSPVREREESRVELIGIHPSHLPASVEVTWHFFRGDEAAVEVGATAARRPQAVQRSP